jgi:hypothetical protein
MHVDQQSVYELLRAVGVPMLAYRRVLLRNRGDEASSLREVLAGVVSDVSKRTHLRRLAALTIRRIEKDRERHLAWERAAQEFDLMERKTQIEEEEPIQYYSVSMSSVAPSVRRARSTDANESQRRSRETVHASKSGSGRRT